MAYKRAMVQKLLTVREAMKLLRIRSRTTIMSMIYDGRIEAVNINPLAKKPTWRVKVESLNFDPIEEQLKLIDLERRLGL